MEPIETQHIDHAIDAVVRALEAMGRRQSALEERARDSSRARSERLARQVEASLPAISARVLRGLKRDFPGFAADPRIASAFVENAKLLGIFKRYDHDAVLLALQTEFKRYLESKDVASPEARRDADLEQEARVLAGQQQRPSRCFTCSRGRALPDRCFRRTRPLRSEPWPSGARPCVKRRSARCAVMPPRTTPSIPRRAATTRTSGCGC
jgi:hypothetical protein